MDHCLCTRAKLVGGVMVIQSIFTLAKIQVQTFIVSSILGGGGHHPLKLCNCQVHNILTQNRPLLLSREFLVSLPKGVVQLPMY